ncbi:MAG: hypothetical protein VCD00_06410 [Candidatus Hydrogenedentota bacterium]
MADVPVDQLVLRAPRYASRDNEWGLLRSRAQWLVNEAFLVHEGIVQKGEDLSVTLLASDGKEERVTLKAIPRQEYVDGLEKIPATPDSKLPLYRQRGSEFYWMSYLAKEKALFVKFNAVRDADEGPRLGEFTNDMLALIDSNKVKSSSLMYVIMAGETVTSRDALYAKYPPTNESIKRANYSSLPGGKRSLRH